MRLYTYVCIDPSTHPSIQSCELYVLVRIKRVVTICTHVSLSVTVISLPPMLRGGRARAGLQHLVVHAERSIDDRGQVLCRFGNDRQDCRLL